MALIGLIFSGPVFAESLDQAIKSSENPDVKQINTFLNKFYKYSNAHNLEEVKNFYAQN